MVETRQGVSQAVHRSQIKPFLRRSPEGESFPLNYFRLTPQEEAEQEGEWKVERILRHKVAGGKYKFLTKWEGFPESEATLEPTGHFFHRYAAPLWIIA